MEGQPGKDEKLKSLLPSSNNKDIQMQPPTFQDSIPVQPKGAIPTPPAVPTVPTAANSQPMNPLLMASPLVPRKRQPPQHLKQDMHQPQPQLRSSPSGGVSNLPTGTVEYLKAWMMSPEHVAHPYPTEEEKAKIVADTGIEMKQLNNWFVNNRKRYWKPRVEARQAALGGQPFSLATTMELAPGANYVNYNANSDLAMTDNHRGGKVPGKNKKAPPGTTRKQRKAPTKKKRRRSTAKYKTKATGRLRKSSIPKTTLKIVSDENPNRITNPLLATLPPKNSTEEVYGSELYRAMEVVFHPPDTYPLSYYARILGFDVPVVDDQKMPTAFPDVATLPLVTARKDDPFFEIPQEECRLEYKKVNSLGQDLDDQLTLDYVDPVYATLLRDGFCAKELVPCNHSLFSKFDSKRKQGASKQQEVVAMGKTIIPSFDQNWTYSGYPASKTEGRAVLEQYEWTIEEEPVPSSLPPHTFGVVAWLQGKPEAILMYQFMWYSLSNDTKESELVMVITGIGRPRRKPKVNSIASTTDVVVDGNMLASEIATAPEPSKESPNGEIKAKSCFQEPTNSSQASSTPPSELTISVPPQLRPATVLASVKTNGKSNSAPNEATQDLPTPLGPPVITTMIAMILEHTRACNVFYGLWEAPKKSLSFIQGCFRLSKVPSKGNDSANTMVCDLKKSSSRFAFLKLIESEEETVATKFDTAEVHDRLLVRLPNMEEAKSCFEPSAAIVTHRVNRNSSSKTIGNIFTGATGTMREAAFGIRAIAISGDSHEVNIHALQGKIQGDQLQLPQSKGTDSNLEILKSFPIPTSTPIDEKEEKNEILLDLKRKQNELAQIEKGLQPNLRSLMCKILDERIEYEKPESQQKRADDVRILEEHRKATARRKELDQQMQEQLEQDMNAVCSICGDGEVTPDNQILFCEACDIPVHQMCYGVEKVPEGDYYCVACKYFKRDIMKQDANSRALESSKRAREPMPVLPIQCELCPVQYGAYVRCELAKDAPPNAVTKWVHMGCAKWQGLNFSEPLNPECVEDVTTLKREFRRLDYACDICRGKRGAYHKCSQSDCDKWLHMTCARICGLCEVNYGEDVEGNPTEKPWTLFCREHSNVDPEEDTGYKRFSVDELIAMAKEFPEEPMPVAPPPKNRIFNKMSGKERALALANPEYERAFLDEILTKRFAGVRCECCDDDQDASLLQRCSTCGVTVCVNCRISSGKFSADQKYIKCHGCSYKAECTKEGKDFEEPYCDLCHQKGGLLLHGKAKPINRQSYWKNNPKLFNRSIFGKKLWTHYTCAFWSKNVHVIAKDCSAECSDVVMSNGQGYVQAKIPCNLCGKLRGMKTRCSEITCRARGEKKQAYHFHISCARQAGYEVNYDEDLNENEQFYIRCYQHGGNGYNLRARLEDLIEIERRRSGKKFGKADAPMSFNDASRLLNCAMLIVSILGWAWRWAELWVEHDSTWEPLLEPGQKEENMTKAQLKIIDSTARSRCKDARRCRLTAFGAALRNRNYDEEDGFDNQSLCRAFRAVLHTKSLVGPWKEFEINFLVDWLSRAYRSKSRLLGLGDDKIPIGNAGFCYHIDDKSPKFELGNRPLPGKATLDEGQVFEAAVAEPDDFLKPETIGGELFKPIIAPEARKSEEKLSLSPRTLAAATPAQPKRGPGRPRKSPEAESVSPFDKSAGLAALVPSAMKKRRAPVLNGDATGTASTSKKFGRINEKARRAHAVIQFDKLDPFGPLRRGRRGRPPKLFGLTVFIRVGRKILEHEFEEIRKRAESQTGAQPRNGKIASTTDTTSEGVSISAAKQPAQVNGKHAKTSLGNRKSSNDPASESAATLPNTTQKRRVGEMANLATTTASQKAHITVSKKRRGERGQRLSREKINYAESSDSSGFEEENEEPSETPGTVKRPVKQATKRRMQTEDRSQMAGKPHVGESISNQDNRQWEKRVRRRRASSSDPSRSKQDSSLNASTRSFVKREHVYESDFLIPLADLAAQSRGREGGHKRSGERREIDPIQIALEQSQKRAPYSVTKPERLEGKKAAAKPSLIK